MPRLKDEAVSVLKMYCFWSLVWGAKLALAWRVLVPMLFDGHDLLMSAHSHSANAASAQGERSTWDLEPVHVLKLCLLVLLWVLVAAAFIADTLYWYSVVVGVVGGVRSLSIHGCMDSSCRLLNNTYSHPR